MRVAHCSIETLNNPSSGKQTSVQLLCAHTVSENDILASLLHRSSPQIQLPTDCILRLTEVFVEQVWMKDLHARHTVTKLQFERATTRNTPCHTALYIEMNDGTAVGARRCKYLAIYIVERRAIFLKGLRLCRLRPATLAGA